MSRKHFSLLLAVTLVVAVLVMLIPGKTSRESDVEKTRLLPGMQEQVNELAWLRVTGAGGQTIVTLARGDGFWQVEQANGYQADWNQLRTLLADLAQTEIVERKTSNPDYYARLGVEDVSQPDAAGVLLEFDSASNLPAVIVGNRAQGRDGNYVRLKDAAESLLIDRSLEVPRDSMGWLDRNIIHIADTEVVEVEIVHADGERVLADWTVNAMANGLASLTLEKVAPADGFDWSAATRFGLVTADGLRVDADLIAVPMADEAGEGATEHWIRLQAGLYQTAVESAVTPPEGSDETVERAEKVNRRVHGWAYQIPKYKFDGMTKRMDDLLKKPDSPDK